MSDRKLAQDFVEDASSTLWDHVDGVIEFTACDKAWTDSANGNFDEAYELARRGQCTYANVAHVAVAQYPSDPVEAERELRTVQDQKQLSGGFIEMSQAAAKKGNVSDALRFLDAASASSGVAQPCDDCLREIAWAWTKKDGPRETLRWARSMSMPKERGWAILGVAQALGHARPQTSGGA